MITLITVGVPSGTRSPSQRALTRLWCPASGGSTMWAQQLALFAAAHQTAVLPPDGAFGNRHETHRLTDRRARRDSNPEARDVRFDSEAQDGQSEQLMVRPTEDGLSTEELVEMRGLEPSFGRRVRQ